MPIMGVRGAALVLLSLGLWLFLVNRAGSQVAPKPAGTFAFVDVNVVPMNSDRILPHQTVIVRNGRISMCDDVRNVLVPEEAFRINGEGLYLLPGLADMHVHLHSPEDAILFLANGVTTVRNMRGMPHHLAWKKRIESGEMLGPRLYSCGPTLDGVPPSSDSITVVESPEEGIRRVQEQKAAGYDCIKVYTRLSQPAYDAILGEAHRLGVPVSGHVPSAVGINHVLEMKQESIEHLTGYMNALKKGDMADPEEIPTMARATQATGVWNCVTLVVQEKLASSPDAAALLRLPEMQYVPLSRLASWNPTRQRQLAAMSGEEFAAAKRGIEVLAKLTRALHEAGAGILLGTDAPSRFVVPGFSIHEEIKNLTDAGLTPYQAIRAGTAAAAEYLKADFGVIENGKKADLILVKGNPLKDVSALRKLEGVMAAGRWFAADELQKMLSGVVAAVKTPRSRFAGAEPLPAGTQYKYELEQAGVIVGEEQFAIQTLDSSVEVTGRTALDVPFPADYRVRLRMDDDGTFRQIRVETRRPEGSGWLEAEQQSNNILANMDLPFVLRTTNRVEPIDTGAVISASTLTARFPLFRKAMKLRMGESQTMSGQELDFNSLFNSGYSWQRADWTFHRLENVNSMLAFDVERKTKHTRMSGTLLLDSDGTPYSLKTDTRNYYRTMVVRNPR